MRVEPPDQSLPDGHTHGRPVIPIVDGLSMPTGTLNGSVVLDLPARGHEVRLDIDEGGNRVLGFALSGPLATAATTALASALGQLGPGDSAPPRVPQPITLVYAVAPGTERYELVHAREVARLP